MRENPKKDYIAMTVFNRRETTLRCLHRLRELDVFKWATAVVVDDASSDGTADALRNEFSQQDVVVLEGSGDLWWGGGTRMAMEYAYDHGAQTIFWLNDDCLVRKGVLEKLREFALANRCIALAKAVTPAKRIYAGQKKTLSGLKDIPFDDYKDWQIDAINGNCVCIPRLVVDSVGFVDAKAFPHARGDSDYSLRAWKKGFSAIAPAHVYCENEDNLTLAAGATSWLLSDTPVFEIWKSMKSKKSGCYPPAHFHFFLRHWGMFGGLVLALVPFIRLFVIAIIRFILPKTVLIRMWAKRSKSYKITSFYE